MSRSSHAPRVLASAAVAVLAVACGPAVPPAEELVVVEERIVDRTATELVSAVHFETPDGFPLEAYLRRPADMARGAYGVVLIGGRETGREAAAIIPPPLDGLVLAVEYPGEIPDALELGTLVRELRQIRRTARRMPGLVRGAGHWLAARPEVDSGRVLLVGVSFGVPFAAPAGRDTIFRGVALLYGGADLPLLFRTHLPMEHSVPRRLAAGALASLFRDLEPARHVGHVSPRPLLLINGLRDDWVPRESSLRLKEAARPPVRHVWVDHGHLMPWHGEVMREMADSTLAHFEFLDRGN